MTKSNKIKDYYQKTVSENDNNLNGFLKQVGKTFLGEPINEIIFHKIIESILENLNINADDEIIDLGCANGLITSNIANTAKHVYGYDLSSDLIQIAQKFHQKQNITYQTKNILNIDFNKSNIKKMYMYEVLQHFEYKMLRELLTKLVIELNNFSFFIGSIPDQEKLFNFYNTKERKQFLFRELLENKKSHLGNWWYQEQLLLLCEELGLEATILEQDNLLHTAHYRFDILIEKK